VIAIRHAKGMHVENSNGSNRLGLFDTCPRASHTTMRQDEGRVLNKPRGRKPRRTPRCRFTLWRLHACGSAVMVLLNGALPPNDRAHTGKEAQGRHRRGLVRARSECV